MVRSRACPRRRRGPRRGHPHEDEVVALGDDELVHAMGPLRRDEEVEPELPSLGCEPGGVLRGQRCDRILRLSRARRCALRRSRAERARGRHGGAKARRAHSPPRSPSRPGCPASRGRRRVRVAHLAPPGPATSPCPPSTRSAIGECRGCGDESRAPVRQRDPRPAAVPASSRAVETEPSSPPSSRSTRAPYSSRSRIGSRRRIAACSSPSQSVKRTCSRSTPSCAPLRTRTSATARRYALRRSLVDAVPHLMEPDEVRVRVEDDDPKGRLEQKLLEHRSECVRLPRSGLTAQERVPVEAPASRRKRTPGWRTSSPTSSDARSGRAASSHRSTEAVSAGSKATSWNGRASPPRTTPDRAQAQSSRSTRRPISRAPPRRARPPRPTPDRPCAPGPDTLADRDVAAGLDCEPVKRALEREMPPVDRGRRSSDRRLQLSARSLIARFSPLGREVARPGACRTTVACLDGMHRRGTVLTYSTPEYCAVWPTPWSAASIPRVDQASPPSDVRRIRRSADGYAGRRRRVVRGCSRRSAQHRGSRRAGHHGRRGLELVERRDHLPGDDREPHHAASRLAHRRPLSDLDRRQATASAGSSTPSATRSTTLVNRGSCSSSGTMPTSNSPRCR